MNLYETDRLLSEYLLFHYGLPEEVLPWDFGPRSALGFPVRAVTETFDPPPPAQGHWTWVAPLAAPASSLLAPTRR